MQVPEPSVVLAVQSEESARELSRLEIGGVDVGGLEVTMSSLIAKVNKRRAPVTGKSTAPKVKKSASATQKRQKSSSGPAKKRVLAKASVAKNKARTAKKKALAKSTSPASRTAASARTRSSEQAPKISGKISKVKSAQKRVERKGVATGPKSALGRTARPRAVARVVAEPRPVPSPKTLEAVRAFENALKLFNRHDLGAAKSAFERVQDAYADQKDVVAPVRTYIAICEQRMARAPASPKNPDALYNQGVFEFNRGNAAAAIGIFEKALKSSPRADHILYSLATAHSRAGNPTKALDALRRAIAIQPVHRSHARRDPDFAALRNNPDFQRLSGLDYETSEN
ncbi:MAG TPA: tetratricopeptide repeat protein [Blastocatellia bacterium]|nr:tetratricopeptide repeat protein [Blastocatellia bacterium]